MFVFDLFICFSEKEIFREEVHSLEVVRDKLKSRIAELEDDIKKLRDVIEQEKRKASLANEDEVQLQFNSATKQKVSFYSECLQDL